MSKVFRLHTTGGRNDQTDWFDCQVYDDEIIKNIKDPDGADARKQITSIPSPFARIDLVKTAFAEVVKSGELDGKTIYHRMVSEAFDVAEIFFNYDKWKSKFKIIVWDRDNDLEALRKSNKDVADTMEMFLNQDKEPYNFDLWRHIYMLQYIGPEHREMQIVGMTSPCTLFCSTANDHSAIVNNVHFGQDKPFDFNFQPLYARDHNFVKYLYAFRANCDKFSSFFKELDDYMSLSYNKKLSDEMKNYIDNLHGGNLSELDNYKPLKFDTARTVDILGCPFHTIGGHNIVNSDFELRSSIIKEQLPLVLPCECGNEYADWHYVQDCWGTSNRAKYRDTTPIEERILPSDDSRYPYITISDLLEDTILEIPESATTALSNGRILGGYNRNWFFNGNRCNADGKPNNKDTVTLLPLKPLFFEYFTTDELINGVDGKPLIKIFTNASGYRVELQIPTKKGFVEYSRLYMNTRKEEENKGVCLKLDDSFVFAMMPPVSVQSNEYAYYRIAFSTDYAHSKLTRIKVFLRGKEIESPIIKRNDRAENVAVSQIVPLDKQQFDCIQITDTTQNNACGLLLPRMRPQQQSGTTYRFAIDLGTTNTHIEYRRGDDKPVPFTLKGDNSPIQYLCNYGNKRYVLEADLLPAEIGNDSAFSFPMRTALSEPCNLNWQVPVKTLAHVGPAITYEKRQTFAYSNVYTNLKWDNSDNVSSHRVEEYINSLMFLIRSKVLVDGGSLDDTRITWFYPTSMSPFKRNQFAEVWEDAYIKYFGNNGTNIQSITESEAPYLAYHSANSVTDNVATVDIGGGTTDVVIVSGGKMQAITSFRFAADSVFGSGFTDGQGALNGIVNHFRVQISEILDNNGLTDLKDILDALNDKGRSEDIASFLFSLHDNKSVVQKGIADKVDFNAILRNDTEFKLVILLFYISIIYHVSQIVRVMGLPAPRIISFSGNGSKILQTIGKERIMNDLTRRIVESIFGSTGSNGIDVKTTDNPKEQTCRGGLQDQQPMDHVEVRNKIVILDGNKTLYHGESYATAISEKAKHEVVTSVNEFLDFVKTLNSHYSFADYFGVSKNSIQMLDTVCRRDLDEFLSKGIHRKLREMNNDTNEPVQETLFFYPLTGMLNALTTEIYNNLHGSESATPLDYIFVQNRGDGLLEEVSSAMVAQFRIIKQGDGSGLFEFCGDANTALANRDATFDGAAVFSGVGTRIFTAIQGKATPAGNGFWEVTEKATINIQ